MIQRKVSNVVYMKNLILPELYHRKPNGIYEHMVLFVLKTIKIIVLN